MSSAAHFRALAEKCRDLARRATDTWTIAALQEVAVSYDREALRLEVRIESFGPEPRSAPPGD